ncbi:MAG: hypothetical protein R2708_08875 [Vicinamibacterales bacterium]
MSTAVVVPLREPSNHESLVVCLHRVIDRETFLRNAGARADTYASEVFGNLYTNIIVYSLDVKADFDRYFAIEYPTFAEYLRKRLLWDHKVVDAVAGQYKRCARIIFYDRTVSFMDHELGPGLLTKLFMERGRRQ